MAKRNKNKLFSLILVALVLGVGIFSGALIASPSYRSNVFATFNQSKPVQAFNEFLTERRIELALVLPINDNEKPKRHPAMRRRQHRSYLNSLGGLLILQGKNFFSKRLEKFDRPITK